LKFEIAPMGYSGAQEKLIYEKKPARYLMRKKYFSSCRVRRWRGKLCERVHVLFIQRVYTSEETIPKCHLFSSFLKI
jgi:hypothetical protein